MNDINHEVVGCYWMSSKVSRSLTIRREPSEAEEEKIN